MFHAMLAAAAMATAVAACVLLVLAVALNANKSLTTWVACCGLALGTAFASVVLSAALEIHVAVVVAALVASCGVVTIGGTICMRHTQVWCGGPRVLEPCTVQ